MFSVYTSYEGVPSKPNNTPLFKQFEKTLQVFLYPEIRYVEPFLSLSRITLSCYPVKGCTLKTEYRTAQQIEYPFKMGSSPRPISISQLNASRHLHL